MVMFYRVLVGLLLICVYSVHANASVEFHHIDWEIVCDNTLTCRVAGLGEEVDKTDSHISILLERKAGANQPIIGGYVKLASSKNDENIREKRKPQNYPLSLIINNVSLGKLTEKPNSIYQLTPHQLKALLETLKTKNNKIIFVQTDNDRVWRIYERGYNAVMLKMDEVQGRIGTIGAIIKPGKKNENHVNKPIPAPVIKKAPVLKTGDGKEITLEEVISIFPDFKSRYIDDPKGYCSYDLDEPDEQDKRYNPSFYLYKLDKNNDLLQASCSMGYVLTDAHWIIPKKKNKVKKIKFVTVKEFPVYRDGVIKTNRRMREILSGCWEYEEFTWNGQEFVLSSVMVTGVSCDSKYYGAYQIWKLPIWVTQVK